MFCITGVYCIIVILELKVIFLESLAACDTSTTNLVMYHTVNLAFVNYFDNLIDSLKVPILQNWTTWEQIMPISLQSSEFDTSLLQAPKMLKDFFSPFKQKKDILDSQEREEPTVDIFGLSKTSIFNNYIMGIFLFCYCINITYSNYDSYILLCKVGR